MKIAVVGGNGFIGKEFCRYASEHCYITVVIGSDCNAFSEDGEKEIKDILRDCNAMVFFAAKRTTSTFSTYEYFYNIALAERYLQFAMETHIADVVIASSMSVYSSLNIPWKEDEFQTPLSLYGASKQAIDALALWYNANKGMNIKCLRLAQVIGMGERKGYLLNTLIDNAIEGKRQSVYGKGIGRRQYIYVRDVCDAILHCLVSGKDKEGIYNIGLRDNISIIELARMANEVFGNDAGIEMLEDKPEDTKEYLMDTTKAEKELHWIPRYSLKASFEDIKKYAFQFKGLDILEG